MCVNLQFVSIFVTRLTQWVSLVEQELLTLLEHLSSPPLFSGVRVTWPLVFCVCFVDRCLSYCTFSFGHCFVCSSSIYRFWLPLWYLQTLLANHLSEKICLSELSYWCSIWKFRCPANQSLKNDFSTSQVAANWSFNQGFSESYSISIGIWLDCATHANQVDSITLQQ